MTKYREIIRLSSLGFSNRNIALSVPCSRNTVLKVLKRAQKLKLCWPLQDNQIDEALEKLFYPKLNSRPQKRMPDYDYIRKELLRNGVSKSSCGLNTWRIAVPMAKSHSCIHSSATTSNRTSRNIVLPCISTGNPVNRLKLTGQVILQQSLKIRKAWIY